MTDTTTTDEPDPEAAPPAEVDTPAAAEVEPIPFWHRPYVERYLVPFVLPVAVVVGIVVYVLNVSRLFLSAHGHIPVLIGTAITVVILVGATLLAAAPRMRQTSTILVTAGFLISLSFAGWISLGHSQEKGGGETTLPTTLKAKQEVKVTAAPGGALAFQPAALNVTTGLVKIDVNVAAAGHTFGFHEANTLMPELKLNATGPQTAVAFFPTPGTYTYFCSIPGHEAGGMKGVVTVKGAPKTLPEALTEAGNPPTAAGGGE
jgi:plastocyanin